MARQTGPNPFIGRRGNLLGYRMARKYYARIVSSLSAERVLKDPAFQLTMQHAGLLGKASKIASSIYRLLPQKEHGFYRRLTGMAMQMLKQGKTPEEAFKQLYNDHLQLLFSVETTKQGQVSSNAFADELLRLIFSKPPADREKEKTSVEDHPPSQTFKEILSEAA